MGDKLKSVINTLNKKFKDGGDDHIGIVSEMGRKEIKRISTGSIAIDAVLGGGIGVGRVTEIYGPESSGKTTLALQIAAECQSNGGTVAYLDMEHAIDLDYAETLGVDAESLVFCQPPHAEACLDTAYELAKTGEVDLIVVDSVSYLAPKKQIEGEAGDAVVGLLARLMSQNVPKINISATKNNCAVIFINQIRMKIGVMFGSPETTSGGQALKFAASTRIDIRRSGGAIKNSDGVVIGENTKVTIVKNKLSRPKGVAQVKMMHGQGICPVAEAIDLGVEFGIVEKSGSWYSYEGEKIGQGEAKTIATMMDNPDLVEEIREAIIQKLNSEK